MITHSVYCTWIDDHTQCVLYSQKGELMITHSVYYSQKGELMITHSVYYTVRRRN